MWGRLKDGKYNEVAYWADNDLTLSGCATAWGKKLTLALEGRDRLISAYRGQEQPGALENSCHQYDGTLTYYAASADQSDAFSAVLGGKVQHGIGGFTVVVKDGIITEIYKF